MDKNLYKQVQTPPCPLIVSQYVTGTNGCFGHKCQNDLLDACRLSVTELQFGLYLSVLQLYP